jgi:phosphoglycerate dehydrogenase-like enzyme
VGYGSIGRAVASLAGAFGARVIAQRRNPASGSGPGSGRGSAEAAAATGDPGDAFAFAPAPERIVGPEGLHELLAASDIVVLAAPLTPETEGMIDAAALAVMGRESWIINVARGRLIDDRALLEALVDHRIGGAALDAFREEPLPPTSPFYDLSNVIVTPHTAWSSSRVLDRSIDLFCENLRRYAAGEALRNVVDPGVGY